jgi:hypothetical protein
VVVRILVLLACPLSRYGVQLGWGLRSGIGCLSKTCALRSLRNR